MAEVGWREWRDEVVPTNQARDVGLDVLSATECCVWIGIKRLGMDMHMYTRSSTAYISTMYSSMIQRSPMYVISVIICVTHVMGRKLE